VDSVILDPSLQPFLALLKGLRNGVVYGAKVRAPHAFVMTFLFRDGTVREKLKVVLDMTRQHATNLGKFVLLYKSLMLAQKTLLHGGKEASQDSFVAGLIGGYVVFGKDTNVNQQIVLYLLSRIVIGLAKWSVKKQYVPSPGEGKTFPVVASVVWGIVMWLFRHDRDTLQGSLQASMQYLYNDSEKWTDLRTLVWHNK
jgi:peroxisomal membrane protein 4